MFYFSSRAHVHHGPSDDSVLPHLILGLRLLEELPVLLLTLAEGKGECGKSFITF